MDEEACVLFGLVLGGDDDCDEGSEVIFTKIAADNSTHGVNFLALSKGLQRGAVTWV